MSNFLPGMRIRVIDHVYGDFGNINMLGHTGTIYKKDHTKYWFVKIDNHPGFSYQEDCWIIHEECMEPLLSTNEEAVGLLNQDL